MVRILVMEDEPCIREILEEFLSILGFSSTMAKDGEEGWQRFLEEGPFDLYLLDIKVPKLNGFELARRIREKDARHPIIFLTGLADNDLLEKTSSIRYAYHVKKPITFADLKDTFRKVGLL